jgi:hypothetical protein
MEEGMDRWAKLAVAALFVSAAVAAGCGGDDGDDGGADEGKAPAPAKPAEPETPTLNERALERRLPRFVNSNNPTIRAPSGETVPSRPEVRKASCPDRIEARAGNEFTCGLRGDAGVRGTLTMTLSDDEGNRFEYELKLRAPGGYSHRSTGTVG